MTDDFDPTTFTPTWEQDEKPYPDPSPELMATLRWLEIERMKICTAYLYGEIDEDHTMHGYPQTWHDRKANL